MKKILLILAIFFCSRSQAQYARIYHIGVGQGDATLILIVNAVGDTASILIDAGNSKSKGDLTYGVVNHYLGTRKNLDFIIISHLHSDHLGGMTQVLTDLSDNNWTIGAIIDRAAGNNPGSDDLCYDALVDYTNDPNPPLPTSQLVKTYKAAVGKVNDKGLLRLGWLNLNVGIDLLHTWKNLLPASFNASTMVFRSITGNGYVCTDATDYSSKSFFATSAHNENDYSYAFLFEMGQFKYFTGGDIGGAKPYVDLETPLVALFKTRPDNGSFHFCAYKATHHGSIHSTNDAFVTYTKPTVTVVPSALRSFSGTQLPGQATLTRIWNSSNNRYLHYTYQWAGGSTPYSGTVTTFRDVTLTIDSASFATTGKILVETQQRDKKTLEVISNTGTSETDTCKKHGGFLAAQPALVTVQENTVIASPDAPLVQPLKKVQPAATKKRLFRYKKKKYVKHT